MSYSDLKHTIGGRMIKEDNSVINVADLLSGITAEQESKLSGSCFAVSKTIVVEASAKGYWLFNPNGKTYNLSISCFLPTFGYMKIYHSAELSDNGTVITKDCLNKATPTTTDAIITHTPTITLLGDASQEFVLGSAIRMSKQNAPLEYITDEPILIEITNGGASASSANVSLAFYELGV